MLDLKKRCEKMRYLNNYLEKVLPEDRDSAAISFLAALDSIEKFDMNIANSIVSELKSQRSHLKLIASENYSSLHVQQAMGNLLTDKYSEGYAGHRFYAGCENVDSIESEANSLAKALFGADHAYVQPHSGADANLVAFWAILTQRVQSREVEKLGKKNLNELSPKEYEQVRQLLVNQKVMGMGLDSGGHLTHGYRQNVSAKMMKATTYEVDPKTGLVDYTALSRQVKEEKPLILIAGYSAYPRLLNFAKMREIADSVGAVLMVDMAHFSGLVAGGVLKGELNPVPYADIMTSTTHKLLRGPRGGLVLCTNEFKDAVNKGCPLVLGGPLPHVMAAKALAFKEALQPSYKQYAHQVVKNAKALAEGLMENGVRVLTGGTDNHLLVFDVASSFGLTGRHAESILREASLTVNRNSIPEDINGPWYTSGIRMGTAAPTTLGMGTSEMKEIASIISDLLKETKPVMDEAKGSLSKAKAEAPEKVIEKAKARSLDLVKRFPLYKELVID